MDRSLGHHWQQYPQQRLPPLALVKKHPFNRLAGPFLLLPNRTTHRPSAPRVTMQDTPTVYFLINLSITRQWHNNPHVEIPCLHPLRLAASRLLSLPVIPQDSSTFCFYQSLSLLPRQSFNNNNHLSIRSSSTTSPNLCFALRYRNLHSSSSQRVSSRSDSRY